MGDKVIVPSISNPIYSSCILSFLVGSGYRTGLWKTVSSGILEKDELMQIARVIDAQWPVFAGYLGMNNTTITTIKQQYSSDYREQCFQMLLKWFQKKPLSRQNLVRIIEENMQNPVLAQDVLNSLGSK